MIDQLRKTITSAANPQKAAVLQRFFKTGKGEYAEGDQFLGIVVPVQRVIAKRYREISLNDVVTLLQSPIHEYRLIALFIMVDQFKRGDDRVKKALFTLYLRNTKHINNWDLVDLSAPHLVGEYLSNKDYTTLRTLAKSQSVWERRIAILATFSFIKKGGYTPTLTIAKLLIKDRHDLIHKAVGWMLREVGKRGGIAEEERFLGKYAAIMPRTMLRYAIERFPTQKRMIYLHIKQHTIR